MPRQCPQPFGEVLLSRRLAQRVGGGDDVRRREQQRIVGRRGAVEVEHARQIARLRRHGYRQREVGVAVVEQHGVATVDQRDGVARRNPVEVLAAPRRYRLLAGGVDEDQRQRRGAARHADEAAAIDAFALQRRLHERRDRVLGRADRPGIAHARAEMCDRDRRVAALSADGGDEVRGLHLGAGGGEALDAHDDVLHRAAGAQDRLRLSQTTPRPRPRRERYDARWRPAAAWSGRPCAGASACRRPRRARTSARLRARSCRS